MPRRTVSNDAVKRAATRSVKASAKLEGRTVPADFKRSQRVKKYLDDRQLPPK